MSDSKIINDDAMDILFRTARSHNHWQDKDVSDVMLQALYDLLKYAPTSANSNPARFIFVKSDEQKDKLKPHVDAGNVDKVLSAPVCVIVAQDLRFHDHLSKLFPHTDAKNWFEGNDALIEDTAYRNATLQGGYMILAARALGLDCGPISGFCAGGVHQAFFEGQDNIQVNFLCNLGYGDDTQLFERLPRFDFDDICKII